MTAHAFATAAAITVLLGTAACGRGGGEGAPVSAQIAHPNGVVLQVASINAGRERTVVRIRVMNGRDREIELNDGSEQSYLLTDAGEKLMLVAPTANASLAVPAGQSMDGVLVFAGELPRGARTTLVLNARGQADSVYASSPRFEVVLPLEGAFAGGGSQEASALSNMKPNVVSTLGPRAAGASGAGAGALAASNLQVVEALKTELGATETERGSVVSLAGDVTFDFDKATIRAAARPTLDRVAELIQATGGSGRIAIEGHTDSEGEDAYNLGLSERRAQAVRDYLASRGVDSARLSTTGLGEGRPIASNDDDAGRQRNRRVEVILPRGQAAPAAGGSTASPAPSKGVSTLTPSG